MNLFKWTVFINISIICLLHLQDWIWIILKSQTCNYVQHVGTKKMSYYIKLYLELLPVICWLSVTVPVPLSVFDSQVSFNNSRFVRCFFIFSFSGKRKTTDYYWKWKRCNMLLFFSFFLLLPLGITTFLFSTSSSVVLTTCMSSDTTS